jgi:predicted nucleic acid-binding protein
LIEAATEQLDLFELLPLDASVIDAAGRLQPPSLRSPDAVHLASALRLGSDPESFVTYDQRLAEPARAHGLNVIAPA